MSTTSRFLGLGVALGLAGGLLVGVGLTQPGRAAATTPSAAPRIASSGGAAMAPTITTVTSGRDDGHRRSPRPGHCPLPVLCGQPGSCPRAHHRRHRRRGGGHAERRVRSASAQQSALAAALADAKAQADAIAADTGLSISGVLSVSASVSPDYGVEPMVANGSSSGSASGGPACIIAVPGSGPSATAGPVVPLPACLPETVYQQTLSASVTVEYRVG